MLSVSLKLGIWVPDILSSDVGEGAYWGANDDKNTDMEAVLYVAVVMCPSQEPNRHHDSHHLCLRTMNDQVLPNRTSLLEFSLILKALLGTLEKSLQRDRPWNRSWLLGNVGDTALDHHLLTFVATLRINMRMPKSSARTFHEISHLLQSRICVSSLTTSLLSGHIRSNSTISTYGLCTEVSQTGQRYTSSVLSMFSIILQHVSIPDRCSNLEPDGFLEQFEVGVDPHAEQELGPDNIFIRLANFARNAERMLGKSVFICDKMKNSIAEAGFVDVVETRYTWPMGEWGDQEERTREIGRFNREWWLVGVENWIIATATRYMGVCSTMTISVTMANSLLR